MDYVVGSIAALISGNVTPNRPKLIRRALTPTKHPSSPNVTPKSEFVEDRSIFLSPTQQKKKAIIKKSPKRIFENPDLDITENSESSSPKADKVKKHLKDELEADEMGKSYLLSQKSPGNKLDKSIQSVSPSKKSKTNDSQVVNECTPKQKKNKKLDVSDKVEEMEVEQTNTGADKNDGKSLKKKDKRKSLAEDDVKEHEAAKISIETVKESGNIKEGKKKNKKRKKKNKQAKPAVTDTVDDKNNDKVLTAENNENEEENKTSAKSPKKKKNRKNKNKKAKQDAKDSLPAKIEQDVTSTTKDKNDDTPETEELPKSIENQSDDNKEEDGVQNDGNESDEEISNVANPNAITEMDTDSEHDSDDEIESENEDEDLKTEEAADSSDDEAEVKSKKVSKKKKKEAAKKTEDKQGGNEDESPEKEVNTEEVVKRTLFVGNVPFSNKCKKEIKKIFAEYGEIETVRIRTVPVKDARVTPKLAVIKNEIHPDRSTVNVYVKFTDPQSVERALSANNTVLNHHHLRVSRSASTGVEHDPRFAIFLGNLPFGIEDETLRAKFEKCGEIESVRIVRDKKTNAGKGFGYVNFTSKDGVELALGLSEEDLTVKNRIIRVKRCTHTLSNGVKNSNKSLRGGRSEIGNNNRPNRNSRNNQGPNRFGNQNRNNQGPSRNFGNHQGQRNFGNNQGQYRNSGNQGPSRNFGNNQGLNRNSGNNQGQRNFGNNQNKFGNQGNDKSGASRRIMNKRPNQESSEGPPNKKQNVTQPPREKKQKKEFVGMTGEKKKKHKFDKGSKKKKALSEIMTKT